MTGGPSPMPGGPGGADRYDGPMDARRDPLRPTAEAQAYIERVLGLLGDREPLAVLAGLDGALDERLAGPDGSPLDRARLARPEAPGKWSAHQVVHHLADVELVYGHRLRRALSEDTPRYEPMDQSDWAERFRYAAAPLHEARAALTALRAVHLRVLGALSPADLARAGVHPGRGLEPLQLLLRLWAGHDLVHRDQIDRALRTD